MNILHQGVTILRIFEAVEKFRGFTGRIVHNDTSSG
jgi:hypothetical protein